MKVSESQYCQCMYFVSNAFARKMSKLAEEAWKPVGLSPSHAYLLMMAIRRPGVQPSELVEELQLTPSTITRLIEKLEEKKLVVRTNEGKLTYVFATPKGQQMKPEMEVCLINFYETYTSLLGQEDSSKLIKKMLKLADRV